ncbi:metalloregulator ArsR/SmtB family transcription factor [Myxococcota bacterium]|nr:metalloregulator ArsR/SmtB family transcription factor [Myxococcota bacterium]
MSVDPLSLTFAALADPTRRAILARLTHGEASATELGEPFGLSQPTISNHLKVLQRAGLITRSRDGQLRPAQLNAAPLVQLDRWLDDYRRFWELNLEQLDQYVTALQSQEPQNDPS